jgi:hypothetical protein
MKDLFDVDLTIQQVSTPIGNWCDTGHNAPEKFGYNGPFTKEEPIRFFQVKNKENNGIYCEICLTIANRIAKDRKKS